MLYSIEVDIPAQAEVIDLSYNLISELGKNVFLEIGLTNLKLLNLSHNKIGQIHLSGFEGLGNLRTLDLSYNTLHYFNERWFAALASIQELYLRGNNLKSINQEPRLNLQRLKILDMSYCAIETLHPDVFQYVPNVQILDISENFLIHLETKVIQPMTHLYALKTKGNFFRCKDPEFARLRSYTSKHHIAYDDPCKGAGRKRKTEHFQRMMSAGPQTEEKNVWIYDEDEEKKQTRNYTEVIILCNDTRKMYEGHFFENFAMEVFTLSPLLTLLVVLISGMMLGIILGCICQFGGNTSPKNMNCDKGEENSDDDISLPTGYVPSLEWTYRRQSNLDTLGSRQTDSETLCPMVPDGKFSRQHSSTNTCKSITKSINSRKLWREDRLTPDRLLDVVPYNQDHTENKPLSNISESTSFGSTRTTVISDSEVVPNGDEQPDNNSKAPRRISKSSSFTSTTASSIIEVVPYARARCIGTARHTSTSSSTGGKLEVIPCYQEYPRTSNGLSREFSKSTKLEVMPYGVEHPDNRLTRQISNASSFKPLSRSSSTRKASETSDRSTLLENECCIYDSTPVLVRKDLGDI
ncbi:unnamed protein product [Callosobruchus maculatus]|nr:unnamed protein product [Callosobruchus maculatus]